MRFGTVLLGDERVAVVADATGGWLRLDAVAELPAPDGLQAFIASEPDLAALRAGVASTTADRITAVGLRFAAPYRHPRMIWGIGLNYAEHASDLSADRPTQPASFIKADHTIIGPGENIVLPSQSSRVTAEAELGLVIGRPCYRLDPDDDPLDYLFGFVPVLDQTAEDILLLNPRYLTRAKNFPTFFSFGPEVVTPDEALEGLGGLGELVVTTVRNGETVRSNVVANMLHEPRELIRFHADMMPLLPGDVISTGTPGAGVIEPGDVAEAQVGSMPTLTNPVVAAS